MHDKNITIHLLEYYSELAMHHRVMMLGFVTAYFGINQALLLTPVPALQLGVGKDAVWFLISAGLIITFVLAAAMHHACHFCSTAGMKAIMAADMHYQHLPQGRTTDPFVYWISKSALKVREALAIRSFSVYILALLFIALCATNAVVYFGVAVELLDRKPLFALFIFCFFIAFQVLALLFYGYTFTKHYRYFQIAKRELQLVLRCESRDAVLKAITDLKGREPEATTWAEFLSFRHTAPGDSGHE